MCEPEFVGRGCQFLVIGRGVVFLPAAVGPQVY